MDKKQKIIIVASFILFLPLLVPILSYVGNFHELSISNDPEKWGPFGDFFGGILNTYISFLTLIVTIFIAYEISRLDDKRNEKVLTFEKKRFLNELREAEYRKITTELQKVSTLIARKEPPKAEIFEIHVYLNHFTLTNDHLFPFLNEKVVNDLIESLEKIYKFYTGESEGKDKFDLYEHYLKAMNNFTVKIQKFIMQEF